MYKLLSIFVYIVLRRLFTSKFFHFSNKRMAKGKADAKAPAKDAKKKVSLLAKPKNASGGKAKKKKWSKGKTKEKINNAVYFDVEGHKKMLSEIPKNKLITPSYVSDKLKINVSLARASIKELEEKGLIKRVGDHSHSQVIYTRPGKQET